MKNSPTRSCLGSPSSLRARGTFSRHRSAIVWISLLICFIAAPAALAQSIDMVEATRARLLTSLVTAINSGNAQEIEAWSESAAEGAEDVASRSAALAAAAWAFHREYGRLTLHAELTANATMYEVWFRSEDTKAWGAIGLLFEQDAPQTVRGMTTLRGAHPETLELRTLERDPKRLANSLSSYLDHLEQTDHFSGVVALAHGDQVIAQRAFGLAERRFEIPNTLETVFDLASVSKIFVAIAILQLVERGLIDLDEPIGTYLDDMPEPWRSRTTTNQMLKHTSGIELDDLDEYRSIEYEFANANERYTAIVRILSSLAEQGNDLPPHGFDYTNEPFAMMQIMIERLTGVAYAEYLEERILRPAGMTNTGFAQADRPPKNMATGYTSVDIRDGRSSLGERRANLFWSHRAPHPAKNVSSTAPDMLKLATALRNGTLLRSETLQEMTKSDSSLDRVWGLGLTLENVGQLNRSFGHDGGTKGVSTRFRVYPELDLSLVVLSNFDSVSGHVHEHFEFLLGSE